MSSASSAGSAPSALSISRSSFFAAPTRSVTSVCGQGRPRARVGERSEASEGEAEEPSEASEGEGGGGGGGGRVAPSEGEVTVTDRSAGGNGGRRPFDSKFSGWKMAPIHGRHPLLWLPHLGYDKRSTFGHARRCGSSARIIASLY